jgi:methylmalonyl-CoA mutase C-terminal domain/subunit
LASVCKIVMLRPGCPAGNIVGSIGRAWNADIASSWQSQASTAMTGLHQTPEQVVQAVVQEDADALGLSLLSGAHLTLVPKVVEGLRREGLDDVLVVCGGIIPDKDIPVLKQAGVAEVFTPGAPLPEIARWLEGALDERERGAATNPVA